MKFKIEISAGGIVYKKLKSKVSNLKSDVVWLITQHSQHKGWGFPKGLIGDKDSSEKMEEAALREVEEEGGVKAKIIAKLPRPVKYMYRYKDFLIRKTVWYFLMEYIAGDPKNHDWEVQDAKFAEAIEVRKTLTYKSDKEAFKQALILISNLSSHSGE